MGKMCISVSSCSGSASEGCNREAVDLASLEMLSERGVHFRKPVDKLYDCCYYAEDDLTHGLFFGVHGGMFLLLTSSTVSTPAFSPPPPFKKVFFEHLMILRNVLLWSMTVLEDAVCHASSVSIELIILRMATSTSSLSPQRNRDGMPRIDSFGL